MAGYSGTPLVQKLGLKPLHRLALLGAPADFMQTLGALPEGVLVANALGGRGTFDVILFFVHTRRELLRRFAPVAARLEPSGGLWVAWPKRASGIVSDVSENLVRSTALAQGLVDNKVCAIDDTWSGLRCVVRLVNRPAKKKPATPKQPAAVGKRARGN
jgi:hypothetical protein